MHSCKEIKTHHTSVMLNIRKYWPDPKSQISTPAMGAAPLAPLVKTESQKILVFSLAYQFIATDKLLHRETFSETPC